MTKNNLGITRIIAGKWKHSKLEFTSSSELRPTLSRIKEDMFNWLMHDISGAICLDLFAGSGSLGFEALSRSAQLVYFVDKKSFLINQIHNNLVRLKAEQCSYKLISDNYINALKSINEKFDVIFIDPPYSQIKIENILMQLNNYSLLNSNAKIIYETNQNINLPLSYRLLKSKKTNTINYGIIQSTKDK